MDGRFRIGRRLFGFALVLALGTAFAPALPAGAASTTQITIVNDTPNPAFVLFDFLTIPNRKVGQFAGPNGGTAYAGHVFDWAFLTFVHVYIKPVGQQSESAPTICYTFHSFANSGFLDAPEHHIIALHYDARTNDCWLGDRKELGTP